MPARKTIEGRRWVIYALVHPLSGVPRYVGVTFRGVPARLQQHIYHATRGARTHCAAWLRALLADGAYPGYLELEWGVGPGWDRSEQHWIREFSARYPLTNLSSGGDGAIGVVASPAARQNHSAAARKMWENPEYRAKQSSAQRQKKATPETRAKISEARKRREPVSAETRARISAAGMGRRHTEETRAKISAAQARITDETRNKLAEAARGRTHTAEAKAKMRQAQLGKTNSPETCAKISAAQKGRTLTAEHKARIGAANKGLKRTEEAKARMRAVHQQRRLRKQQAASAEEPSAPPCSLHPEASVQTPLRG